MAGKRKTRKRLSANDISTSSSNILHSINHIKANENKVIFCLVIFFICIFICIGYFSLKVDSTSLVAGLNNNNIMGISVSTSIVTLDSDDIMSDEEGLKTNPVVLSIQNKFSELYSYKLLLISDENLKNICECNEIDKGLIHYSLDGKTVKTIDNDNMLLDIDSVDGLLGKDISIRIWVSDSANLDENTHFHGKLVIERCYLKENN